VNSPLHLALRKEGPKLSVPTISSRSDSSLGTKSSHRIRLIPDCLQSRASVTPLFSIRCCDSRGAPSSLPGSGSAAVSAVNVTCTFAPLTFTFTFAPRIPASQSHKFSPTYFFPNRSSRNTNRHSPLRLSRATLLPASKTWFASQSPALRLLPLLFLRWENYLRTAHSPHQNSQGSSTCYDRNTCNAQVR
jgi:hypothetical protein